MDIQKWVDALKAANQAAIAAAENKEDGGTCNLDTVIIDFTGWRKPDIAMLKQKSGIDIGDKMESGIFKGYRFVWTAHEGQANLRTRMVVAAYNVLHEAGLPATVWYQMD